jgi:hypothetical protein
MHNTKRCQIIFGVMCNAKISRTNKFMLTVEAIYDGKKFVVLERFPKEKRFKVIITFVEELDEREESRDFTAQNDSFEFWNDQREDIYQDFLIENEQ